MAGRRFASRWAVVAACVWVSGCGGGATSEDARAPDDLTVAPSRDDLRPQVIPDLAGSCKQGDDCGGGAMACCSARCVDLKSDPQNCGGCGVACGAGKTCCMGSCEDLMTSLGSCGACGNICMVAHGKASCTRGQCGVLSCDNGWSDCNSNMGQPDGCETASATDVKNCGSCGRACTYANATPGCSGGMCALVSCNAAFADCDNDIANGCEADTGTDKSNCGACGSDCTSRSHAKVACAAGACGITSCDAGFADCNKISLDGCEIDLNTAAANCGSCGTACPKNTVCKAGQCTCPPCNFPNVRAASCQNLACVIDTCVPGYFDCDKQVQNGCESDTSTDARNCGACGNICPNNMNSCLGGKCTNVTTSCNVLHMLQPQLADGVYTIDMDGAGPIAAFATFCDMTTDGGGWTVCYQHQIVDVEEMNHSTTTNMGSIWGVPGAKTEFGTDCRTMGHTLQPTTLRFTAADGVHWVQINNAPDLAHEFFFSGNKAAGQMVNITTWNSGGQSYQRLLCVHDCPNFAYNANNINQIASGTNAGNCFEHNSKNSDSNHHWAMWGKCDGTYVEGPNQGAGGAQPDQPRAGWARVMMR